MAYDCVWPDSLDGQVPPPNMQYLRGIAANNAKMEMYPIISTLHAIKCKLFPSYSAAISAHLVYVLSLAPFNVP